MPLTLLLTGDAFAQCKVVGTLRSSDGELIRGASVRMRGPELPSALTTTTDDEGRWTFENVKPGVRVEIVALENGRPIARSFALVTLPVESVDLRQVLEPRTGGAGDLDPQGGPSAEVRGVVRSADGASIAGARVAIRDTTIATTTDSAGRFAFSRIRSGLALELDAAASGFNTATAEVAVPPADHIDADFVLEAFRSSRTEARSIVDSPGDSSALALQPEDVSGVPSLAPMDVFRALQYLPEAVGTLESASDLYVRGGTPDQTLVRLDGFTIYPFSNVFGALSALNMDAVARADFSGGASDAADGGRLAGVLKLTGETNPSGKPTASVSASLLGVSTKVTAPLGDRAAFLLTARRSPPTSLYNNVLDRLDSTSGVSVRNRVARFSGGLFPSSEASSFSDVNGKLEARPDRPDRVSVSFYDAREAANDSRDVALPGSSAIAAPSAVALPDDAVAQISAVESWRGRGMSAVWERQWSPAAASVLSIGRSEFSKMADASSLLASASTGQDDSFIAGRGGSDGVSESNRVQDTTFRLTSTLAFGFQHVVNVGGEAASLTTDYDGRVEVFQRTAASTGYASKLTPLLAQSNSGRTTAAFIQDAWRPIAGLTISPGIRVNRYDLAASTFFEPRVSASYEITRQLRVRGAWSIDHQSVTRIVREDQARGDGEFWALADGSTIPVARARQADVGVGMVSPGFAWDTHAFYKVFDDLTLFAPRLFPGVTLNASGSLFHHGSGRSSGIETLFRYKSDWNTGWTSYTLSRAEYTYPTLEASTFSAPFDQTHELKVADVARLRQWSLGAAWVLGSGRPNTPVTGTRQVWFPSGDAVYEVTFGPKNSARLAPYHRLDVSAQRDVRLRALSARLAATLFNVFDRENVARHDYETVGSAVAVNDVLLMRRTLNVVLTLGF